MKLTTNIIKTLVFKNIFLCLLSVYSIFGQEQKIQTSDSTYQHSGNEKQTPVADTSLSFADTSISFADTSSIEKNNNVQTDDSLKQNDSLKQDVPSKSKQDSSNNSIVLDSPDSNKFVDTLVTNIPSHDSSSIDTFETDTSYRAWNSPFWSIGFGWELGSMPAFDLWHVSLPVKISDIPEMESLNDSLRLKFNKNNDPGSYNINFPLSISYTPYVSEFQYITLRLQCTWFHKKFEASITTDDSLKIEVWETERSCSFSIIDIGLFYSQIIPESFFSIEAIERASIVIGVSGSPFVYLHNRIETTNLPNQNLKSFGVGISWYAGVNTLRPFSKIHGTEVTALYHGSWYGKFMYNDHHVTKFDINPNEQQNDILQFITHRFILNFNIAFGKKNDTTHNQ